MNKLLVMSQKTLRDLVILVVDREPGVTSDKLWRLAKEWDRKLSAAEFDGALGELVGKELRVANKCWYLPGVKAEKKLRGPSAEDPRQTRMFG